MILWNIWAMEPYRSGLLLRHIGQVKARSERSALAVVKRLRVRLDGLELLVREAAYDDWHRPR
jgi:hypothetical protein